MSFFRIFPIVTGHGEERAFPILLRRLILDIDHDAAFHIATPWRCREGQILSQTSPALEQAVRAGVRTVGDRGAVIVLLDCEDGCPANLGPQIFARATAYGRPGLVSVVCAYREYESWFLWSLNSLAGTNGLRADIQPPDNPEQLRGAKEWISRQMVARRYSETVDQAALTQMLDINAARRSDSFDKLYRDVEALIRRLREQPPR